MKLKSIAEVKLENSNVWKLNNTLVSSHWVKKRNKKRKLENISRQTKIKHNMPKLIECNKNSTKGCGKILVVLGNN